MELIGTAGDGLEALSMAGQLNPDLLLLELVKYCVSVDTNGCIALFRYSISFFN